MRTKAGFTIAALAGILAASTPGYCGCSFDGNAQSSVPCGNIAPPPPVPHTSPTTSSRSLSTPSSSAAQPSAVSSSPSAAAPAAAGGGWAAEPPSVPQISAEELRARGLQAQGIQARDLGDYQTAADIFRKALALLPGDATLEEFLRQVERQSGDIRDADRQKARSWSHLGTVSGSIPGLPGIYLNNAPGSTAPATGAQPAPGEVGDHDTPAVESPSSPYRNDHDAAAGLPAMTGSAAGPAGSSSPSAMRQLTGTAEHWADPQKAADEGYARDCFDSGCAAGKPISVVVPASGPPPAAPPVPPKVANDPSYKAYGEQQQAALAKAASKQAEYDRLRSQADSETDQAKKGAIYVQMSNTQNDISAAQSQAAAAKINQDDVQRKLTESYVVIPSGSGAPPPPPPPPGGGN